MYYITTGSSGAVMPSIVKHLVEENYRGMHIIRGSSEQHLSLRLKGVFDKHNLKLHPDFDIACAWDIIDDYFGNK